MNEQAICQFCGKPMNKRDRVRVPIGAIFKEGKLLRTIWGMGHYSCISKSVTKHT